MTTTTNKGYILQAFGDNAGTWGDVLNDEMIKYVDLNLGGIKSQSLSNINETLSASDSRNVIYRFTGTLTANVTVTLTSYVGFLIVENLTSGAFTVSVKNNSVNSTAATIEQGTRALLISDSANPSPPSLYGGVKIISQTYTNLVNTFSAGSTGLTPSTATAGAVTLAGTLNVANGGTGLTTLTANNVILGNGASTPQFVAPGTSGNFLTSNGTTWTSSAYVNINYSTVQGTPSPAATTISFNNVIPSNAKKITMIIIAASLTNGEGLQVQLGYGAGPTYIESGYTSQVFSQGGITAYSAGMGLTRNLSTGDLASGCVYLTRLSDTNNYWAYTSAVYYNSASGFLDTLPSALTSVRLKSTSVGNFDSGLFNISWET